jgi:hypothetical protein
MCRRDAWQANIHLVNAIDHHLSEALQIFHEALDDAEQDQLFVGQVSYPFLAHLMREGRALLPSGEPIAEEFLLPTGVAFGIILSNTCEVLDSIVGGGGASMPQALLDSGSCIGIFELIDGLAGDGRALKPDWTIVAGAENIHAVCATDRDDFIKRLRNIKYFDDAEYREAGTLAQRLRLVPSVQNAIEDWNVQVLYFSRSWFDLLKRSVEQLPHLDSARCSATQTLLLELFGRAWHAISSIRGTGSAMYNAFVPSAKASNSNIDFYATQAYYMFSHIVDVLSGRRPAYTVSAQDDEFGPYQALRANFLEAGGARNDLFFLRPGYLDQRTPHVYLPLEHHFPRLFSDKRVAAEALQQAFSQIRNAYSRSKRQHSDSRLSIGRLPEILNCLSFRTPTEKKTRGAPANSTFKIHIDERGQLHYPAITESEFFSPSIDNIVAKNTVFFRPCMRIDLPESFDSN